MNIHMPLFYSSKKKKLRGNMDRSFWPSLCSSAQAQCNMSNASGKICYAAKSKRTWKGRASVHKLIAFFSSLAIFKAGTFQRSVQNVQSIFSSWQWNDGHRSYSTTSAQVTGALGEEAVT